MSNRESSRICGNSSLAAFGFGKNYFHNFGEATKSQICYKEDDEKDVPTAASSYQFEGQKTPWQQDSDDALIDVKCTIASTFFLTRSGKIYFSGTLHGKIRENLTKQNIALPLKCVQLATGRHFCLARMEGGLAVCSWGAGHFGQLGIANDTSSSSSPPSFIHHPTVVESILPHVVGSPISSVAAGYWHSMVMTQDGRLFSFGCNRNAQVGVKPSSKEPPTICRPQLVTFDNASSPSNTTIRLSKIAAGRSHSVALDNDGQVYCWGACQYGQCGALTRRRVGGVSTPKHVEALAKVRIIDISAGDVHTLALTGGGRVFGWGGNSQGQLGIGYCLYSTNPKPKLVSDLDFVAIEASKVTNECTSVSSLANTPRVTSVIAKGNSSFAITSMGHVYCWGNNDVGNLGLPKPGHESLTYLDPHLAPNTSSEPQFQTLSFDSSHNIAIPQRLEYLRHWRIASIGSSSTFMWCLGTEREDNNNISRSNDVVKASYEVDEENLQESTKSNHNRILISLDTGSFATTSIKKSKNNNVHKDDNNEEVNADTKMNITSCKDSFDSHRSKSGSSLKFSAENSKELQISSPFDKSSASMTLGQKKRLFSPKKLVKGIVRLASGRSSKSETTTFINGTDAPD